MPITKDIYPSKYLSICLVKKEAENNYLTLLQHDDRMSLNRKNGSQHPLTPSHTDALCYLNLFKYKLGNKPEGISKKLHGKHTNKL